MSSRGSCYVLGWGYKNDIRTKLIKYCNIYDQRFRGRKEGMRAGGEEGTVTSMIRQVATWTGWNVDRMASDPDINNRGRGGRCCKILDVVIVFHQLIVM